MQVVVVGVGEADIFGAGRIVYQLARLLERHLGALPPLCVHHRVVGDAEQPARKTLVAIFANCRQRLEEGVAGGILRRFVTAQPDVAIAVDGSEVAAI